MTRRALMGAGLAVGLLLAFLVVPPAPAQTAAPVAVGSDLVGMFLSDKKVVFEKPTNNTSKSRSLTNTFSTPVVTNTLKWGNITRIPYDLEFTTDGVFTLYLAGKSVGHVEEVQATLTRGSEEKKSFTGTTRLSTDPDRLVMDSEPVKVTIGMPLMGERFNATNNVTVQFAFFGAGVTGSGVDVVVLYNSTRTPSGLVVGVNSGTKETPAVAGAQPLYLADNDTLSLAPPTSESDHLRDSDSGDLTSIALADEWEFGSINTTSVTRFETDTPVSVWIKFKPDDSMLVGATRDLRVALEVNGTQTSVRSNVRILSYTFLSGPPTKYVLGLPTAGLVVPEGATLRLNFTLWSTDDDLTGHFAIVYGSIVRPSSLTLGVPVGTLGIAGPPGSNQTSAEAAAAGPNAPPHRNPAGAQAPGGVSGRGGGQSGGSGTPRGGTGSSGGSGPNGGGTPRAGGGAGETPTGEEPGRAAEGSGHVKDVGSASNPVPGPGVWLAIVAAAAAVIIGRRRFG